MKSADPIQTHRAASALLLVGALGLSGLTVGCASNSPRDYIAEATLSEVGSREASYAVATTPADLKRLIAEDLEYKNAQGVYTGLEAFVGENVTRRTATRANLIWKSVRPTTMLQYGQGRSVMTSVKQLGDVLANEGVKEMETAFESLRQGDFEEVQRLRDEPMGIFHSSTAELSREVRPYAMLADGVLSYRDVAANPDATDADVQVALDKLAAAQSELALIGETRGMFLADAAAAQALERAGQIDAAAEYWMRIADSDEFLGQPEVMRQLVAARIKTYSVRMKERLIIEVESERRAELRARDEMYSAQVDDLQAKHRSFDDWAQEGFENSTRRIAELSAEDESQKAQLVSLAQTAEVRDGELARATDALAVRLGTVLDRTVELETKTGALEAETGQLAKKTDALAEETASLNQETESLSEKQDAMGLRVDREVAQMRTNLHDAVASLRKNQAGETLVTSLAKHDSELAQSLQDLADYETAVDELTANVSLDAMDAAFQASMLDEASPTGGAPADGVLSVPAYLAVHTVPDVFGVDGNLQKMTAYYIPE